MAAKKVVIDWEKVDKFLIAQCSGVEIAAELGIHENTLYAHCKEDHGMEFMAYSQEKKQKGKGQLRLRLWASAIGGDKTLQIWLSKQYLGMKDKTEMELTAELTVHDVTDKLIARLKESQ